MKTKTTKRLLTSSTAHRTLAYLMLGTGLSNEACRRHIVNGTKPTNSTLCAAWDKALKDIVKS